MNNQTNIPQAEFERIESYLLRSMATDEIVNFEKELAENLEFSAKVHEVEAILEGIEEAALRARMEDFHQDFEKDKKIVLKKGIKFPWLPFSVAASLLLLIGLFTWLFFLRPSAEEQLFMAYYQPDPGLVTAMGSSMEYEFDRGMVDYKMGEYAAAIQRWEKLHQEKPGNDTLNYFLGAAYLGLKNSYSAESYFRKVIEEETSKFTADAYWYLGLANVLNGDVEMALINLEKSNHPDKEKLIQRQQKK